MSPRRATPHGPRSIVAAARRIDLKAITPDTLTHKRRDWEHDAWDYFDEVGEVKELILWRGNQLAKVHFYVAALPPGAKPDDQPLHALDEAAGIPPDVAQAATDMLARVKGKVGGQAGVFQRLELNLEVVGEAWVVKIAERPPDAVGQGGSLEEWMVCSKDEVDHTQKGDRTEWRIKRSPEDKEGTVLDPDAGDDIFRIWQPHAHWFEKADCAMRGVVRECETLELLTNQAQAEAKSRASAGIFCIPNELSFAGVKQEETPDPNEEDEAQDPFITAFIEAIASPAADPSHPNSVVPFLVRGPKEHLHPDALRHIDLSRVADPNLDNRIENRIVRIARSLNAPVEIVMGSMQTTYANARQIDRDVFEDYIEPRVLFDADAFTIGMLRPGLDDLDVPPEIIERMFVWYDASDLVSAPDTELNANEGWDRNLLSDEAWRREKGFNEHDAPDALEILLRLLFKQRTLGPDVNAALIDTITKEMPGVNLPTIKKIAPPTGTPAPAAITSSAVRAAHHLGRTLVGIDQDLRTRLIVAANAAMARALEKAGNRLRSRSPVRATLKSIAPPLCAARVGPAGVAAAGVTEGDLLAGAFDQFKAQFYDWTASAQREAVATAAKVTAFHPAKLDEMALAMSEALDIAWAWLCDNLMALAQVRLYEPIPASGPGETDPSLVVPPGLIRGAMARAGGPEGISSQVSAAGGIRKAIPAPQPLVEPDDEYSNWTTMAQGGTEPAGGIGTGQIITAALADQGFTQEAYVWDYGSGARKYPFAPHEALNGQSFDNFDDDILASEGEFGFDYYMPGDHDGCLCDFIPILLNPADEE